MGAQKGSRIIKYSCFVDGNCVSFQVLVKDLEIFPEALNETAIDTCRCGHRDGYMYFWYVLKVYNDVNDQFLALLLFGMSNIATLCFIDNT